MSSSATTVDHDAQTWVYPPPGSQTPPIAQTGNIGPVSLYDEMTLQWEPDTVVNEIHLACFSESLEATDHVIASGQGQPFTYQFSWQASQSNSSDSVFCHMYFVPSQFGNTIVWQYLNSPGSSAVTWPSQSTSTSASVSSSSTATSSSASRTTTSTSQTVGLFSFATTTAVSTGSVTPSSHPKSGLSTGASAGIGVGVAIGVLLLIGALLFFWRRQRQRTRVQEKRQYAEANAEKATDHWQQPPSPQQLYSDHRVEVDGTGRSELPSKRGSGIRELDA